MSEPIAAPDARELLRDLRELRTLASAQNFDLFVFLRELGDDGAPILGVSAGGDPRLFAGVVVAGLAGASVLVLFFCVWRSSSTSAGCDDAPACALQHRVGQGAEA